MKLEFSGQFFFPEKCVSSFTKIPLVGAELIHADGHHKTNSRFSQNCEKLLRSHLSYSSQLVSYYFGVSGRFATDLRLKKWLHMYNVDGY
jgi:hypothetical protein